MKRRVSVGRVRMASSLVSPAEWHGGHLDIGCEVWVIILFEHAKKGRIFAGVVMNAVPLNNVGGEWKYTVQVPSVGFVIGLQPAEISPLQFGKPWLNPSTINFCSGAFLFKTRNAKRCGGQVQIVRCNPLAPLIHSHTISGGRKIRRNGNQESCYCQLPCGQHQDGSQKCSGQQARRQQQSCISRPFRPRCLHV